MKVSNYSQLMNSQTVEAFTRAYQCAYNGNAVDQVHLKPLLNLTEKVYSKGFSKNMVSVDDQYHAGFYLKDLPGSLKNGKCKDKSEELYQSYVSNHYMIDPNRVVSFVNDYFDELKNNVYAYLLVINLISNTTAWELPDHLIYQFNELFNQIGDL